VNGRGKPDLADKSISELVAADSVDTSHFIDNKLKAFFEFITSDDNPIGKKTHYYYRQEYQAVGCNIFISKYGLKMFPLLGSALTRNLLNSLLNTVLVTSLTKIYPPFCTTE